MEKRWIFPLDFPVDLRGWAEDEKMVGYLLGLNPPVQDLVNVHLRGVRKLVEKTKTVVGIYRLQVGSTPHL